MHPADIQAELKKRDITQKNEADSLGVSPMAISLVVHKMSVSDRIMTKIASDIDRDKHDVFPEYFFSPRRRTSKRN